MSKSDAVGELFLCNAWCFLAHQRECLEQLLQQLGANADEDLVQAIVGCNQAVVWCLAGCGKTELQRVFLSVSHGC